MSLLLSSSLVACGESAITSDFSGFLPFLEGCAEGGVVDDIALSLSFQDRHGVQDVANGGECQSLLLLPWNVLHLHKHHVSTTSYIVARGCWDFLLNRGRQAKKKKMGKVWVSVQKWVIKKNLYNTEQGPVHMTHHSLGKQTILRTTLTLSSVTLFSSHTHKGHLSSSRFAPWTPMRSLAVHGNVSGHHHYIKVSVEYTWIFFFRQINASIKKTSIFLCLEIKHKHPTEMKSNEKQIGPWLVFFLLMFTFFIAFFVVFTV